MAPGDYHEPSPIRKHRPRGLLGPVADVCWRKRMRHLRHDLMLNATLHDCIPHAKAGGKLWRWRTVERRKSETLNLLQRDLCDTSVRKPHRAVLGEEPKKYVRLCLYVILLMRSTEHHSLQRLTLCNNSATLNTSRCQSKSMKQSLYLPLPAFFCVDISYIYQKNK